MHTRLLALLPVVLLACGGGSDARDTATVADSASGAEAISDADDAPGSDAQSDPTAGLVPIEVVFDAKMKPELTKMDVGLPKTAHLTAKGLGRCGLFRGSYSVAMDTVLSGDARGFLLGAKTENGTDSTVLQINNGEMLIYAVSNTGPDRAPASTKISRAGDAATFDVSGETVNKAYTFQAHATCAKVTPE